MKLPTRASVMTLDKPTVCAAASVHISRAGNDPRDESLIRNTFAWLQARTEGVDISHSELTSAPIVERFLKGTPRWPRLNYSRTANIQQASNRWQTIISIESDPPEVRRIKHKEAFGCGDHWRITIPIKSSPADHAEAIITRLNDCQTISSIAQGGYTFQTKEKPNEEACTMSQRTDSTTVSSTTDSAIQKSHQTRGLLVKCGTIIMLLRRSHIFASAVAICRPGGDLTWHPAQHSAQEENPMVRIQFELPEEKVKELEALMREAQISTRKDLFNNALTLFEWALQERKTGRTIASVDEHNKKYKELVMPALAAVGPKS
jgi:hypothetical protein